MLPLISLHVGARECTVEFWLASYPLRFRLPSIHRLTLVQTWRQQRGTGHIRVEPGGTGMRESRTDGLLMFVRWVVSDVKWWPFAMGY